MNDMSLAKMPETAEPVRLSSTPSSVTHLQDLVGSVVKIEAIHSTFHFEGKLQAVYPDRIIQVRNSQEELFIPLDSVLIRRKLS